MNEKSFDEILDERLDLLSAGASIEECVAPHPHHADQLRAQLTLARELMNERPQARPSPEAMAAGRARLLGAAAQQPDVRAEHGRGAGLALPALFADRSLFTLLPKAIPAVIAMLVLGGAAWGVSAAATGDASPGGWFASSSSSTERVEVGGTISAIGIGTMTIGTPLGNVTVVVTEQTEFEGENDAALTIADFVVGDAVKVSAVRDDAGSLVAREIEHEGEGDGAPDNPSQPAADQENENSGPGNADDIVPRENEAADDDDNSGPGNVEDRDDESDDDNSGPGSSDDKEKDKDDSGHGGDDVIDD